MIGILLEQMINHLLTLDKDIDVSLLSGKLICLSIKNTSKKFTLVFNGRLVTILSQTQENTPYDIDITMSKKALMSMLKGADMKTLLKSDELIVIGDAKVAQALFDLIVDLELDYEEILAFYTNNTIANRIGQGIDFLKKNPPPKPIINLARSFKNKVKDQLFT